MTEIGISIMNNVLPNTFTSILEETNDHYRKKEELLFNEFNQ